MAEHTARYFYSSLFQFSNEAPHDLLERMEREHPDLRFSLTYDHDNAIFEVACPTSIGLIVDQAFSQVLRDYTSREAHANRSSTLPPKVTRFPASLVHHNLSSEHNSPFQEPQDLRLHDKLHARDTEISSLLVVNNEVPVYSRFLTYKNPRHWCVVCAVPRDQSSSSALVYNKNTGKAVEDENTNSSCSQAYNFIHRPVIPIKRTSIASNVPVSGSKVKVWDFDGPRVSVTQWLAGMGRTKLVDPSEKSEAPPDSMRVTNATSSRRLLGRARVARVSQSHTTADSSGSEIDSNSDSDIGESGDSDNLSHACQMAKNLQLAGSPRCEPPADNFALPIPKLNQTSLSKMPDGKWSGFRTHLPTSSIESASDVKQTLPMANSVLKNESSSSRMGDDGLSHWHGFAQADKYGMFAPPSKQAAWDQVRGSISTTESVRRAGSYTNASVLQCANNHPSPWTPAINEPEVPTGILIDISHPATLDTSALETSPEHVTHSPTNMGPMMGKLIDVEGEDSCDIVERLQQVSERSSEKFYRTMNQRAKRPSNRGKAQNKRAQESQHGQGRLPLPSPILSPKPIQQPVIREDNRSEALPAPSTNIDAVEKQLKEHIKKVLDVSSLPSKVMMRFGILLMQSKELQDRAWSARSLQDKVNKSSYSLDFVERLTTSDDDINALIKTDLDDSSVCYELHLVDLDKRIHILAIDPLDLSNYTVRLQSLRESITICNVLRFHDMRLEFGATENISVLFPRRVYDSVVDSFQTNAEATEVWCSLPSEFASVAALRYKHVLRAADTSFVNVLDLELEAGRQLRARRYDDNQMCSLHRKWWEIFIDGQECIQNSNHGQEICLLLFKRAGEWCKLIDGLGFNNEGPLVEYAEERMRKDEIKRAASQIEMARIW